MKTITKDEELHIEGQTEKSHPRHEVTIRKRPKSQQFSSIREFIMSLEVPKNED